MTSRFRDRYDRDDGDIGTDYIVPCGGVQISDEAVVPIDAIEVESGLSPIFGPGTTALKTQVLFTSATMDGPDYVVRTTWAHDDTDPSSGDTAVTSAPSFTILARMSKDPLLFDLGVEEEPFCFDQGYGARLTFPLDDSAPTLKIVKYQPRKRVPNLTRPATVEVDGAVVLASVVLDFDDLNLDDDFDSTTYVDGDPLPYKGNWQDMRLRIRRADNEVILEVYLNDRNLNQVKIEHTDKIDPLWGAIGLPGYEFLSADLVNQPSGTSPFNRSGLSLLRCGLFSVETILDVRRPVRVTPGSFFTYQEITNRVILLVEKDGDAKYNATTGGTTKFDTYLQFVLEAEADIIRKEGYYDWLRREQRIYLRNEIAEYEMPEDLGVLDIVRPGNWNNVPLRELPNFSFRERLAGVTQQGGRPVIYTKLQDGPNNRPRIRLFPIPLLESVVTTNAAGGQSDPPPEDAYLVVEYFARQLRPLEPDIEIPFIPQQHVDVLIYGGAAHAMLLDTDPNNMQAMAAVYNAKLTDLRRENNRKVGSTQTIAIAAADLYQPNVISRIPLLRSTQLESLLAF